MYRTSAERVAVAKAPGVPLRVRDFGKRGRGIVADRDIAEGELIERSPVIVVPEPDRAAVDASHVGNYIFMWEHDSVGEDIYRQEGRVAVVLGYASLVNHSDNPNCRFIRYIDAEALDLIALRDIEAGEELTFSYGMTLWFTPD